MAAAAQNSYYNFTGTLQRNVTEPQDALISDAKAFQGRSRHTTDRIQPRSAALPHATLGAIAGAIFGFPLHRRAQPQKPAPTSTLVMPARLACEDGLMPPPRNDRLRSAEKDAAPHAATPHLSNPLRIGIQGGHAAAQWPGSDHSPSQPPPYRNPASPSRPHPFRDRPLARNASDGECFGSSNTFRAIRRLLIASGTPQ